MYTVPRNTRILGKNLIFRPEVPSTNTLAFEFAKAGELTHGSVVITDHQTAGKGQSGTVWSSEPLQNLTLSVFLQVPLAASAAFQLNMLSTLAVADLCSGLRIQMVRVKWPNDVLVNGKKISGILCENSIQGDLIRFAVIGIGLNVNQFRFDGFQATSLALECGRSFQTDQVFHELLGHLERRMDQLGSGGRTGLEAEWLDLLLHYRETHTFQTPAGPMTGTITGIDPSGRLIVETDGGTRIFGPKEISP